MPALQTSRSSSPTSLAQRVDVVALRDVADERASADRPPRRASTCSRVRPVTATCMPAAASSRAMFSPIPRPPPVTSATASRSDWPSRRSPPVTPGSRATTGRPDPCRARARARRGARSSPTARLRQRGDPEDALRLERLAEHVGRPRPRRARPSASRPASATQKIHATSPFTACGTPIAAASATMPLPIAADSSSAGPMRLPAMLSVSSLRPCRNQ